MFGMFKTAAQRRPLSREAGVNGVAIDIANTARKDNGLWVTKTPLMQGCLHAYGQGNPDNLAAFLENYIPCALEKRHTNMLATDDSFRDLVYKPLLHILSSALYSPQALAPLQTKINPSTWSLILDACVSRAALRNDIPAAKAFIALGGKADEWRQQPLRHAASAGHVDMTRLLLDAGANAHQARPQEGTHRYDMFMKTIKAAKPDTPTFTKARIAGAAVAVGALAGAIALVARKPAPPAPRLGVTPVPRTTIKKPVIRRPQDK